MEESLGMYGQEVTDALLSVISDSMDDLVRKTRATAPKGSRGSYRRNITSDKRMLRRAGGNGFRGTTARATWYVKAPDYRLTHLIVHGHAKKNGGRTKSNPFLQNALDVVLPEYELKVKEAIKNGSNN